MLQANHPEEPPGQATISAADLSSRSRCRNPSASSSIFLAIFLHKSFHICKWCSDIINSVRPQRLKQMFRMSDNDWTAQSKGNVAKKIRSSACSSIRHIYACHAFSKPLKALSRSSKFSVCPSLASQRARPRPARPRPPRAGEVHSFPCFHMMYGNCAFLSVATPNTTMLSNLLFPVCVCAPSLHVVHGW